LILLDINDYNMTELPHHSNLQIKLLSRCFRNVSNSYKFYWFLSILDHVLESESAFISLDEISLRMLSSVWYPLDFYKLSFGVQDGFKDLATNVSSYIKVDNSPKAKTLYHQIENDLPDDISKTLKHKIKVGLKRWVVFRFLSPFFEDQLKGMRDQKVNDTIQKLTHSSDFIDFAPYKIVTDGIVLSTNWIAYFKDNQYVLRGFIKWHLVKFLQRNNSNVVGLTEKLEKPTIRNLKTARSFWSVFLKNNNSKCLYSGLTLPKNNFSLDHFIPWSYVAHDQLWNIIPTTKSVNSSKSDSLPSLSYYLDAFCEFQYAALNFHIIEGNNKLLEDFHSLFRESNLMSIEKSYFFDIIKTEISNNYRIAENLGFKSSYIY